MCICTKWQQTLFGEARGVCLDATHDVTGQNVIMYTIVTQHQETWRGFPIAYLITNSQASSVLTTWLKMLSGQGLKPASVTIDCSLTEDKALKNAWGTGLSIRYCAWHVSRAWTSKISLIKTSSNTETQELRKRARDQLKEMMWVERREDFDKLFKSFLKKWRHQKEFIEYFEGTWGDNSSRPPKRWAKSYHSREFDSMATNNYVETWHNQLKTVYLNRRPNRRLDTLIHKLVEDINADLQYELKTQRAQVGRMHSKGRYICEQRFKAKNTVENMAGKRTFNNIVMVIYLTHEMVDGESLIKSAQSGRFVVSSFEMMGLTYTVSLVDGVSMLLLIKSRHYLGCVQRSEDYVYVSPIPRGKGAAVQAHFFGELLP